MVEGCELEIDKVQDIFGIGNEDTGQRGRAIGYLASVMVNALGLAELEERVVALELALKAGRR